MRFELENIEANPYESDNIELVLNLEQPDEDDRFLEPAQETITFVRKDKERVLKFIDEYGYTQGMPLSIILDEGVRLEYQLDFTRNFEKNRDFVNCHFKRVNGIDSFVDNANGTSFEIVDFSASDFSEIDYVVIPDQQALYFITLSIAFFSLQQEIGKSVQEIQEGIADIVKASVPVGVPPAPDWGAIIVAGLKLAARIAYFIFIVISLVIVIRDIIQLIFPKVRQYKCISLFNLFIKCALHLGYNQVQSQILTDLKKLHLLVVPLMEKDPSVFKEVFLPSQLAFTKGYPSARDTITTFGELIDYIKNFANARLRVFGNKITLENETFFENNAQGNLLSAYNMQEDRRTMTRINSDEIFKRKLFINSIDVADINTLDDQKGSLLELSTEQITSPYPNMVNIRGFQRKAVNTAKATRKGKLSVVEETAKALAKAVDFFAGSSLSSQIDARKNIMQISQQYFTVTKWAWMNGSRLDENQNAFISMLQIYEKYHKSKDWENNLKEITTEMPVALKFKELLKFEENNYTTLDDGSVINITKITWNDKSKKALIDFEKRIPNNNVKTLKLSTG